MSDYNQSQYRLMLAQLVEFEEGTLSLNSLVADIQDPFRNLVGEEADWKKSFMDHWVALEQIRSTETFRGHRGFVGPERHAASDAVAALKAMVQARIDDPLDPNSPIS
ncbi:MAG: hypothetical protein WDN04_06380 [Rhodospirillales bacterium]